MSRNSTKQVLLSFRKTAADITEDKEALPNESATLCLICIPQITTSSATLASSRNWVPALLEVYILRKSQLQFKCQAIDANGH